MKNLKDFGKRVYNGFRDSTLGFFAYPTYRKSQNLREDSTIGDEIVEEAVSACVVPFEVGSALAFPQIVLPAVAASNAFSYFKERGKNSGEPKVIPKRNIGSRLLKRMSSTLLAGAFALGVHNIIKPIPTSGDENFNVVECSYQDTSGNERNLYVLGEVHNYNQRSSIAAKALSENLDFNTVYREGPEARSNVPLEEKLLFLGLNPFVAGAGFSHDSFLDYSSPSKPVLPLEKYSQGGGKRRSWCS